MKQISKKVSFSGLLLLFILAAFGLKPSLDPKTNPGEFPYVKISNGLINANLYLPDAINGYYRGSRFDWSGVIPELQVNGHSYFGQWFETYDPYIHDAIMGPVDDFYPLGYDEARPGESFIKIGIGVVAKSDDKPYSIREPYKLVNPGKWKIRKKSDQVTFNQILNSMHYSYEYTKTVRLVKNKPVMVLAHTILNRGESTIETNVYNHNFFVIDKQPTGPAFSMEFPFKLTGKFRRGGDMAEYKDNKILFLKELSHGQTMHGGNIKGFSDNPADYDIKIENYNTRAGVRITCDKPLSDLVFWASNAVVSAEPYTHINIKPSEKFSWTVTYEFYTIK